ncbi:MAG: reverse transcriptase domain-containing protein [Prevotellaceae bacterium]|nr:reverse transcriptase domain-containing protein [Prevotellaceae bacterium]
MEDKILKMFFEFDRWESAIAKGIVKDVPKATLYQLCKPEVRMSMYEAIRDGKYEIAPPHTAQIPKDTPGEFRTVYVNEAADRVLLSIANDLLFELMPDKVHPSCKSYLKGIGCGKVVQEASAAIVMTTSRNNGITPIIGWKSDLSKYFDSVPIEFIDQAFDMVEERHGRSALIDVLRKYYHADLYFTPDGVLESKYQSLKQGCSVASWLADVLLYHIDELLSSMGGFYVRYSDDMLYIGDNHEQAMAVLEEELAKKRMKLNPKKVEMLDAQHWFKFLGFSIRGKDISMSNSRIKKFQKEIEKRTIKGQGARGKGQDAHAFAKALNQVNRYLYHGDGQGHSWATGVLGVVNVRQDIDTMNAFVMDALRAVQTDKTKIGGLGYDRQGKTGCIVRGKGRNVTANRRKTGDDISGYISLGCMQNAIRTSKAAYDSLVRELSLNKRNNVITKSRDSAISIEDLESAYAIYKHSIPSEKTMHRPARFYALPESELSNDDMLYGVRREDAERDLEKALRGFAMPEGAGWFWQSENDPDLVVLRSWTNAA